MILRLDDKSSRGFSKYEYRLRYAGLALAMIRETMPKDFKLRVFCDQEGLDFARRMGVPSADLFYNEISAFNPNVSDSVVSIMIAGGMCEGLPDPFLVFPDGIIITDFEELRSKPMIVWSSSDMNFALQTPEIESAMTKAPWHKMETTKRFYNASVIGGISSPVWIQMSNTLHGTQDFAYRMDENDTSVFLSWSLGRMTDIKEFTIAHSAIRAPHHKRGTYTETDMLNVRRRLRTSYRSVDLALEQYLTDKGIY